MKLQLKTLEDTDRLAKIFAKQIADSGAFVCLYGEIGAGKTTFTKSVAKYLNIKETVTSPSFVILNEYHSGILPVYHFDLYRLESEGVKTIAAELEEYSYGRVLTLIEWAQFSNVELPQQRMEINITYGDDTERTFEFKSISDKYVEKIKAIENEYINN